MQSTSNPQIKPVLSGASACVRMPKAKEGFTRHNIIKTVRAQRPEECNATPRPREQPIIQFQGNDVGTFDPLGILFKQISLRAFDIQFYKKQMMIRQVGHKRFNGISSDRTLRMFIRRDKAKGCRPCLGVFNANIFINRPNTALYTGHLWIGFCIAFQKVEIVAIRLYGHNQSVWKSSRERH